MRKSLIIVGAFAVVLAGGAWYFLNPAPPEAPQRLTAPMATLGDDAGLYRGTEENAEWLVTPALDGGWMRHRVDRTSALERLDDLPEAQTDMRRRENQSYRLGAVALDRPISLEGWLFSPAEPSGVGIVVLHGSGGSDRRNGYYIALVHRLVMAGHTVILPDKRGSGRSAGDWRNEPLGVMAADGAAWLEKLREETDLASYGFVGVSQGGSIAPEAARLANADFALAIGSSATDYDTQLRHEVGNGVRDAGVPEFLQGPLASIYTYRAKRRQPGFWAANGDYDSLAEWRDWRGPYFIAYGAEDERDNVPVGESVRRLEATPADGRPKWRVYEGVGHGLTDEDGQFASAFLRDLQNWLERFGSARQQTEAPR